MKKLNKEKILRVIMHPLIIAIPFALISIFLLRISIPEVSLKPTNTYDADKGGKQTLQYYHDLDQDSIDEEISHFVNSVGQCAIKVTSGQDIFKGQWNFEGSLPEQSRSLTYVDVDADGVLDIFTLFQRNDSIFLGCVNPENDAQKIIEGLFIDKVKKVNDKIDFSATLLNADLDGDNRNEVLISINAGYSEQPRRIYAYNFVNDSLMKSPMVGFKQTITNIAVYNEDGKPRIFCHTTSNENIEAGQGIPFDDYQRWAVIYDHTLNYSTGPLALGKGSGSVKSYVFDKTGQEAIWFVDINYESKSKYAFYHYNKQKENLDRSFPGIDLSVKMYFEKYTRHNQDYLMAYNITNGAVDLLDPFDSLKVLKHQAIEPDMTFLKLMNINEPGESELLFLKTTEDDHWLHIYSNDLQNTYVYKIPSHFDAVQNITTRQIQSGETLLVIQADDKILEFIFEVDRFSLIKTIALHAIIYGFYVLLISIILYYQKKIIAAYYRREQELAELKLKSIRSQLDPHFTFNAINAVSAAILREDKDRAYRYFSLFSKLMRSTMLYSDQMTRLLSDELEFTKNYLDIEKFRFREKFNYQINVEPEVNTSLNVPRNIIETFAESAVSNGLMHRSQGGDLSISLTMQGRHLIAVFIDNGVGTEKAKIFNKEKAFKAVKIMDEFIRIYNRLNHTRISYKMFDLDGGEEFPGTAVEVRIPMKKM